MQIHAALLAMLWPKDLLVKLLGNCSASGQAPGSSKVQDKPPDHVVVFVHGMGKALKGGTLQEWAQPLAQSLSDFSLDDVPDSPCAPLIIDKATAVGDTPEMRVWVLREHEKGQEPLYASVLMTEASWGADFAPATATDTYWWGWTMASRVFDRSMYLLWWNLYPGRLSSKNPFWFLKRVQQIILCTVAAVVGFILLIPALILLGALILLANVPGIGRFVGAFVALFADFLGDPQVWKRRPLQAAAMRQRIRHTLAPWDNEKVPVTLVAHSQGAAVAGQVLFQHGKNGRIATVTNFVTVGSGLSLLGYAQWGGSGTDPVDDWMKNTNIRWINMWGKFDFVPAGPISTDLNGTTPVFKKVFDRDNPEEAGPGPEEHPVYNRAAVIYDHIVYSRNRIEVIDPIARLILPAKEVHGDSPPPVRVVPIGDQGDRRLKPHRVLVKGLTAARALSIVAGIGMAPAVLFELKSFGWVRTLLQCSATEDEQGPWWSVWLCYGSSFSWAAAGDWLVLGFVAAVIAGVYIAILNGPVWGSCHGMVERRRKDAPKRPHHKPGDLARNRPGKKAGKPWRGVYLYIASACVATLVPLFFVAGISATLVGVLTAVVLFAESFRGVGITPLAARRPA